MNRTDVVFDSRGTRCAAWLYHPEGTGPHPCVILAQGFGAIREHRLDAYATRFAQIGLAALVFDYRHFGASEGEPRQLLDIKRQLVDWAAAISYARTLDGIDAERIALWGSSFSGGLVIETAAQDKRIAAVVAQVPFTDGLTTIFSSGVRGALRLAAAAARDDLRRVLKKSPYYIKIVGPPGALAVTTGVALEELYRDTLPPGIHWENSIAARALSRVIFFRPIRVAARVQCPLLICVCDHDRIIWPKPAMKVAKAAPNGELLHYHGGHFDIYLGELFDQMVTDQCHFLAQHLLD